MGNSLEVTPLHALHIELGAKMVPFAGYDMPVQYPMGVMKEHLHTRESAGLFDVSHMGQVIVSGEGACAALEALLPVDLQALAVNQQTYAVMTNAEGGIRDDLIIARWGEEKFFLVVNAACKAADIAYVRENMPESVQIEELKDQALLALQGPLAVDVMAAITDQLSDLIFMNGRSVTLHGVACYVTRSGYTGEDGFEISLPNSAATFLARQILADQRVQAIGLGARDSLRLEAGLCLYGHDLDVDISPIEAGLQWSISAARRAGGAREGGFPGAEKILQQMVDGVTRRRVGLAVQTRAPVREGAEVVDAEGAVIGTVCSGGFAPSLGSPIAMAYLRADQCVAGKELSAIVRGKSVPVKVVKMPFVPQRYYRG